LPLGFVGPKAGLIAWLLIQIASASLSIWILWKHQGSPATRLHLFGYGFAPILACMMAGQLGIFFLLSVTLFLYLHRARPFLAGALLLPCAMKPHLFVPFGLVLLLWMIMRRQFSILIGFALACAASCALAFSVDPQIWSQYTRMMRSTAMFDVFIPTLSTALRFLIDRHAVWLQFVPEALACLWALGYFWARRTVWNWMHQGLLVLLVSVACAPYAWFTDEAVLLPAILAGLYTATEMRRSLLPLALFAGISLLEVLRAVPLTSPYYLWTPIAWLAWYLYATRSGSRERGIGKAVEQGTISSRRDGVH
jgi:Glycosyltransferase family 87